MKIHSKTVMNENSHSARKMILSISNKMEIIQLVFLRGVKMSKKLK
jgi:hypothetical protein